MHLVANTAK